MNPRLRKAPKREAGIFWQMACGHALTGDYLKNKIHKTENDACWHCDSGQPQTRTHLFTQCAAFREERKEFWKEV